MESSGHGIPRTWSPQGMACPGHGVPCHVPMWDLRESWHRASCCPQEGPQEPAPVWLVVVVLWGWALLTCTGSDWPGTGARVPLTAARFLLSQPGGPSRGPDPVQHQGRPRRPQLQRSRGLASGAAPKRGCGPLARPAQRQEARAHSRRGLFLSLGVPPSGPLCVAGSPSVTGSSLRLHAGCPGAGPQHLHPSASGVWVRRKSSAWT